MSNTKQIEANRKNAKRSTGPRTALGKVRARHNALRHGLAVSIASDPELSAEAECLARLMVLDDDDPSRLHYARIAADAEIEILRVRKVRTQLLSGSAPESGNLDGSHIQPLLEILPQLTKCDRYERRAFSRRKRAIREFNSI
jgi:hypothetical protein